MIKRFHTLCASLTTQSRLRLAAIAVTVWLASCAAPTVQPPTDEELNQMAEEVLTEATYVHALLSRCGAVSPELRGYAQDLRDIWLYTHGDALAGADTQYTRSLSDRTLMVNGQPIALEAVQLKHQQEARAAQELRLRQRSANNQRLVCERRFGELEQRLTHKTYLNPASDRDLLVHETLMGLTGEPVELAQVPSLAAGVPLSLAPGRSYRSVEKRVNGTCPDAELVVLENDWPTEAYGVYCDGQANGLYSCEWGECQSL